MRDRLIELISQMQDYGEKETNFTTHIRVNERIADHLLANGIIVPPCKVGDMVYAITEKHPCYACRTVADYCLKDCHSFGNRTELVVKEGLVEAMLFFSNSNEMRIAIPTTEHLMRHYITKRLSDFGKTVFLTREEAEKALAERITKE
jgi:hypothetical protein